MRLICIKRGRWINSRTGVIPEDCAPKYGELVTVLDSTVIRTGVRILVLAGYQHNPITGKKIGYNAKNFRSIADDDKACTEDFRKELKGLLKEKA